MLTASVRQSLPGTSQLAQTPNTSTMRIGPRRPGSGSEETKQLLLSAAESDPWLPRALTWAAEVLNS